MVTREAEIVTYHEDAVPRADSPLREWLDWLESGSGKTIDLGLERCRTVAAKLDLTRPAPTVVTVAGTNGKGSSVALLQAIWLAAGYRVGAYTSPHLSNYNERMHIGGLALDDRSICAAFASVEQARGDVALTYFEFATLAALLLFEHAELDVAILEVGLGGRLDAVNIVDSDVALIAAIGLDHEDWLGETREQIGSEKAGIMRASRPVVCSDHAAPDSISHTARTLGADLHLLGVEYAYEQDGECWTWWSQDEIYAGLPLPALNGTHQLRNAAGVLKVVRLLAARHPVEEAHLHAGLRDVALLGRFHCVSNRYEYVMDVAHNPQAAEIFVATLNSMPNAPRTHAIIGMLNTKNHREYLRPLLGKIDSWHFADLPAANGAPAKTLRECLATLERGAEVNAYASVEQAHAGVLASADSGDRILAIGSCLTVGEMLRVLDTQLKELD